MKNKAKTNYEDFNQGNQPLGPEPKPVKQVGLYSCTKPCSTCPYRKDVPVQTWAKEEFADLLKNEASQFGTVYQCHKNNGSRCIGWLMDQDKRRFPSINLRLDLSKNGIDRKYLDKLKSPKPMYENVVEMVKANYPELLK